VAASPFAMLNDRNLLRLVTDAVHEDDALHLALTCLVPSGRSSYSICIYKVLKSGYTRTLTSPRRPCRS
jgi:hypothetical protein